MRAVSSKGEEGCLSQPINLETPFLDILLNGNRICNSSAIIRKNALEDIGFLSEDPTISEDTDCWLRLGKAGYKFFFLDECLGYYWVGDNMSGSMKHFELTKNVYNKYMPEVPPEYQKQVKNRLNYILALKYYKIGKRKESISMFSKLLPVVDLKTKLKIVAYMLKIIFNIKFSYS